MHKVRWFIKISPKRWQVFKAVASGVPTQEFTSNREGFKISFADPSSAISIPRVGTSENIIFIALSAQ